MKTQTPRGLNFFLDAIDGSYCTYTYANKTGDDPKIYPQDVGGKHDCGTLKVTNVTSLPYVRYESHYPVNYMIRRCNEFMKLALQGVTVVAASGDSGVTAGWRQMHGPRFRYHFTHLSILPIYYFGWDY